MDEIRDSLSKFKKDIKHRFGKSKRKGDEPGLDGGDGSDSEDENAGASAADRPDLGPTATSSAKLILRGVRDSADAFGPLKSVAGGLCFILENYEVRYLLS